MALEWLRVRESPQPPRVQNSTCRLAASAPLL